MPEPSIDDKVAADIRAAADALAAHIDDDATHPTPDEIRAVVTEVIEPVATALFGPVEPMGGGRNRAAGHIAKVEGLTMAVDRFLTKESNGGVNARLSIDMKDATTRRWAVVAGVLVVILNIAGDWLGNVITALASRGHL